MVNWEFAREVGYLKFFYRTLWRQFSKRVLRIDNTIKLPNGLYIVLPSNSSYANDVFVTKCNVDWGSEELLIRHLDKGRSFLDVGANIGYYSLMVSPHVKSLFAFEPDPRNLRHLDRNIVRTNNATIVQKAVFSRSGQMKFMLSHDSATSHLLLEQGQTSHSITVETITLDEFATQNPLLEFTGIKVDVEGSDLDVLFGAKELIRRDQPLILTEFTIGENSTNDEARLLDLTRSLNYTIFAFVRTLSGKRFKRDRLLNLDETNMKNVWYKMLFLVPERLASDFISFETL